MKYARTTVLLSALTASFLGMGYLIAGEMGMLIALVIAFFVNGFAYWNSDKMVLTMYGARRIDAADSPFLHDTARRLAERAGLPMPKLFVIDENQPNAFATGRNPDHAAVAVTRSLMELLDRRAITGVLAHELAHIRNRDTLIMTVAATVAGAVSMLANFAFISGGNRDDEGDGKPIGAIGGLLLLILAPLAAMVVQLAISRGREFEADRIGAEISGDPNALADALAILERGAEVVSNRVADQHPATAHMFIVNPLHMRMLGSLFSTHPRIAERIARLRRMAHYME